MSRIISASYFCIIMLSISPDQEVDVKLHVGMNVTCHIGNVHSNPTCWIYLHHVASVMKPSLKTHNEAMKSYLAMKQSEAVDGCNVLFGVSHAVSLLACLLRSAIVCNIFFIDAPTHCLDVVHCHL